MFSKKLLIPLLSLSLLVTPAYSSHAAENAEAAGTSVEGQGMLSPSSSSESSESVFNGSGAGTSSEPVTDEKLETILKQVQSQLPAENGTWAVFISDLVNGTEGSLNDQKMQAASLIKLYIMGAVYENYDQITGQYGSDSVDSNLYSMITVSDNESCNELGRLQSEKHDFLDGAEKVNEYLKKEGYTKTSYQSTLHPSASKLITLGGHNQTTVTDCGKLLERIYRGECVSKEASEEMLDLLKNQQNTSKIPEGLGVDVPTANKTGETDEDQHDIAIVYGTKTTYILCVMSENASNAIANIRNISRVVYNYLNL